MERITFVIEFEDGKAPLVNGSMEAFGGKVVAVAFRDALKEEKELTIERGPSRLPFGGRCLVCNHIHPAGMPCPLTSIKGDRNA